MNRERMTDLITADDFSNDQKRAIGEIAEKARVTLLPTLIERNSEDEWNHYGKVICIGSRDNMYDFTIEYLQKLITQADPEILRYFDPRNAAGLHSGLRRDMQYIFGNRQDALTADVIDQILNSSLMPEGWKIAKFHYAYTFGKGEGRYEISAGSCNGGDKEKLIEGSKRSLRYCTRWKDEDEVQARIDFLAVTSQDEVEFIRQTAQTRENRRLSSLYFVLTPGKEADIKTDQPAGLEKRLSELNTSEDPTRLKSLVKQLDDKCKSGFENRDEVKETGKCLTALLERQKSDLKLGLDIVCSLGNLHAKEGVDAILDYATYVSDEDRDKEKADPGYFWHKYSMVSMMLERIGGQKAIKKHIELFDQGKFLGWRTWCARDIYHSMLSLKGWIKQEHEDYYYRCISNHLIEENDSDDTYNPDITKEVIEKFKQLASTLSNENEKGQDNWSDEIIDMETYIAGLNCCLLGDQKPEEYVKVK